jgi:hypothetical protein
MAAVGRWLTGCDWSSLRSSLASRYALAPTAVDVGLRVGGVSIVAGVISDDRQRGYVEIVYNGYLIHL